MAELFTGDNLMLIILAGLGILLWQNSQKKEEGAVAGLEGRGGDPAASGPGAAGGKTPGDGPLDGLTMKGLQMNRCLLALAIHLLPMVVAAQDPILVVTKSGYFTLSTDATGVPSLKPVKQVIDMGDTPTTPPVTPGTDFEKEVERITKEVLAAGATKQTGARISAVYSVVAEQVASGAIAPAKALEAIKLGTDLALSGQADSAKWVPWRNDIGDALTALAQEGKLNTKEHFAGIFKEIERGLNAATGFPGARVAEQKGEGILDGFDLAKIIELIKLLLELFKIFKPS